MTQFEFQDAKPLPSIEEAFDLVKDGSFIFFDFESTLRGIEVKAMDGQKQAIVTFSTETRFPQSFGFGLPTDSPLLPKMNEVMKRLLQVGIMDKWIADFLAMDVFPETVDSGNIVFTLSHLQSSFYLLITGLGISTAAFLMECLLIYRSFTDVIL